VHFLSTNSSKLHRQNSIKINLQIER
jgi:hypothetical protein